MARILIVDDERYIRSTIKDIFENEKYIADTAADPVEALDKIKTSAFDLILSDIVMPKMNGKEFIVQLQDINFEPPVIIMSAHGDIQTAVECIKLGAFDFLEKPIDLNRLLLSVRNALDKRSLVKETKTLKKKIQRNYELIGESASIQKVRRMINMLADTDSRVLITGDNGTGKEVIARQIYQASPRQQALHRSKLRRHSVRTHRKRTLRTRKGGFHFGHKKPGGKIRTGRRGNYFPRRNRRYEPVGTSQNSAAPAGKRHQPGR